MMGRLTEQRGDLLGSGLQAVGHGVNTVGAMGAGIAVQFRRRWPAMYDQYREECRSGHLKPGSVFVWYEEPVVVYNLATQPFPGPCAQLSYIASAVRGMLADASDRAISTVGLPRLGAGYGGLEWGPVKALLDDIVLGSATDIVVYYL